MLGSSDLRVSCSISCFTAPTPHAAYDLRTRDWRQTTRQATVTAMRCLPVADISPGMILARPARALDGSLIYKSGMVLEAKQLGWLKQAGLHELWVVRAGEAVPDPTVPEYLDRYGPDFAARLQGAYSRSLVNRTMQSLFLAALAHATDCYRRYRLDEREEQ